jgi:cyclopropane-fatty-acyl-phospholipid synthase
MPLARFLAGLIRSGRLTLIDAKRRRVTMGRRDAATPEDEPHVIVRIADRRTEIKIAADPGLYGGEAYMDGTLTVENGDIHDLIAIVTRNAGRSAAGGPLDRWRHRWGPRLRRLERPNSIRRARANVAHHYDLSRALYERFLDRDLQYSCGYFERPGMTLEAAQEAKKRHIARKLLLRDGHRVLDVGCGWGGLALSLARAAEIEVLGITLSKEQLEYARARAEAAGLSHRVRFEARDYREVEGGFDRIVSVGMFEHVGVPHFGEFFGAIRARLNDGGVALVHSIGRSDGPGVTNPWIRKYIFPGGYSPALSETLPAIERAGLWLTDLEIWRLHYAETLRHWRARLLANRARIEALYDERFFRMWEFYLAGSECAFRHQGHMVFQAQLARSIDAVPLARNYMYDAAAGGSERASGRIAVSAADER